MAIQKPLTIGIDSYPSSYTRITQQFSDNNKENTIVTFRLETFASEAHYLAKMRPIGSEQHRVKLSDLSEASFTGLYLYLKTLPGFEEAIDV